MVDRPILFSAAMVQALLAGRKTQTRRLAWREKECPGGPVNDGCGQMDYIEPSVVRTPAPWRKVQPGDRLWVREAWALPSNWTGPASRIAASCLEAGYKRPWAPIHYPADGTRDNWGRWREHEPGKGRPSIHMPRWASRMTLTVTDVRVQRLQEISEEDAMAEGADPVLVPPDGGSAPHVEGFRDLWNSLHGPGAWDANPDVVALSFITEVRNVDA